MQNGTHQTEPAVITPPVKQGTHHTDPARAIPPEQPEKKEQREQHASFLFFSFSFFSFILLCIAREQHARQETTANAQQAREE